MTVGLRAERLRPARRSARARAATTGPLVWVNGRALQASAAHVSAFDGGFALADGVFESLRIHDGVAFRADRHLRRLARALGVMRILPPEGLADMLRDAVKTAALAGLREATARLTVTRGISLPGPKFDEPEAPPTVILWIGALPLLPEWLYTEGITAVITAARRDERSPTAGIKTLAYTDALLALRDAQARGAHDAILLDLEGHVSEGAMCNIFACTGGALVTPPASCGVLCGITREAIIECARSLGVPVAERPLWPSELLAADELFTTQSLRGVIPLSQVDGRAIGDGARGPVTRLLIDGYRKLVRRECASGARHS